jgi:hypothetical protein
MVLAIVLFAPVFLSACGSSKQLVNDVTRQGDIVSGTGTIEYFLEEGGFFAIRGSDKVVYDPRNLPLEFQETGLIVTFQVRVIPDAMGTHMVGPIVEVLEIKRK